MLSESSAPPTGDLKCGNILIDDAWTPLVADFGLSNTVDKLLGGPQTGAGRRDSGRASSSIPAASGARSAHRSRSKALPAKKGSLADLQSTAGTLRYLAPELLQPAFLNDPDEPAYVNLQAVDAVRWKSACFFALLPHQL